MGVSDAEEPESDEAEAVGGCGIANDMMGMLWWWVVTLGKAETLSSLEAVGLTT